MDARKVTRSVHEGARNLARAIAEEDEWLVSRRERKKVEMLFAHLKRILRLDQLRLRGPNGARDEFHLPAAAQNLRKLAKAIPMPMHPVSASHRAGTSRRCPGGHVRFSHQRTFSTASAVSSRSADGQNVPILAASRRRTAAPKRLLRRASATPWRATPTGIVGLLARELCAHFHAERRRSTRCPRHMNSA